MRQTLKVAMLAWMLWSHGRGEYEGRTLTAWSPMAGYDTKAECEAMVFRKSGTRQSTETRGNDITGPFQVTYTMYCFPDTFNPRIGD